MNSEMLGMELVTLFSRYDKDRSGELDMREISILFAELGLQPRTQKDQEAILKLLQEVDQDGSNTFSFDEFTLLVSRMKEQNEKTFQQRQKNYAEGLGYDEQQYKHYLRLFTDLDEDSKGCLGPNSLKLLLAQCHKKFTDDQVFKVFMELDEDCSGFLEFPEYLQLMAILDS